MLHRPERVRRPPPSRDVPLLPSITRPGPPILEDTALETCITHLETLPVIAEESFTHSESSLSSLSSLPDSEQLVRGAVVERSESPADILVMTPPLVMGQIPTASTPPLPSCGVSFRELRHTLTLLPTTAYTTPVEVPSQLESPPQDPRAARTTQLSAHAVHLDDVPVHQPPQMMAPEQTVLSVAVPNPVDNLRIRGDVEPIPNDVLVYLGQRCAAEQKLLRDLLPLGNEYTAFTTIHRHQGVGSAWDKLRSARTGGGKNWLIVGGMYVTLEMLVRWSGRAYRTFQNNVSLMLSMNNAMERIAEGGGLALHQAAAERALQHVILLQTIPQPLVVPLPRGYECNLTALTTLVTTLEAAEVKGV